MNRESLICMIDAFQKGPCKVNFMQCKDDHPQYWSKLYIRYVKGWELLEIKQTVTNLACILPYGPDRGFV